MRQNNQLVKTLSPNLVGRDFVIGDLHGALDCLKTMMAGINFDKAKDRIISVGDLIDRGTNSLECLQLIDEPWFHAVQGNHEKEMIDVFSGVVDPSTWFKFGGKWAIPNYCDWQNLKSKKFNDVYDKEGTAKLLDLVRTVRTLPLIITVELANGKKVHVVHAEFPHGEKITDTQLADPAEVERIVNTETKNGSHLQWGRSIFGQFIDQDIPNRLDKFKRKAQLFAQSAKNSLPFNDELSHIISGHSIVHCPVTFMGQTVIDTAAYETNATPLSYKHYTKSPKWAGLTCVNLNDWTFFKSTQSEFIQVQPVILI